MIKTGTRVRQVQEHQHSPFLGQSGTVVVGDDMWEIGVDFDGARGMGRVYIPAYCLALEESDAKPEKKHLKEAKFVMPVYQVYPMNNNSVGRYYPYLGDGVINYYGQRQVKVSSYSVRKIEINEEDSFKITNTEYCDYTIPPKVMDNKVHKVKSISNTGVIIFEYFKETYKVNVWNVELIHDTEPRINDTIFYKKGYARVLEKNNNKITLVNGATISTKDVVLYRRRPTPIENPIGKLVKYISGRFGNNLVYTLNDTYRIIKTSKEGDVTKYICGKDDYIVYFYEEDIEVLDISGDYLFVPEGCSLLSSEVNKLTKFTSHTLKDFTKFKNEETDVEFLVKSKKSDIGFYRSQRNANRPVRYGRGRLRGGGLVDGLNIKKYTEKEPEKFEVNGTLYVIDEKKLLEFDTKLIRDDGFVRDLIENDGMTIHVYTVKRKDLNNIKQKTKITNGF